LNASTTGALDRSTKIIKKLTLIAIRIVKTMDTDFRPILGGACAEAG
jgi:hypothetical protein